METYFTQKYFYKKIIKRKRKWKIKQESMNNKGLVNFLVKLVFKLEMNLSL